MADKKTIGEHAVENDCFVFQIYMARPDGTTYIATKTVPHVDIAMSRAPGGLLIEAASAGVGEVVTEYLKGVAG